VPFKNQTIRLTGSVVVFNGHEVRLWKRREIEGRIKSGSFSQDARGRWYCNLVIEYEPKPNGKNAEVGIDLGLKEGMTLSTGAKIENSRMFAKYEDALRCARACRQEASHPGNPRQDRQQPKGLPPQGDNEDRRRLRAYLRRQCIGPLAAGDERQVVGRCQH